MSEKNIIDVVPLTKVPLTRDQSFCYTHEKKLPLGTLVAIPFAGRKIEGVVVAGKNDSKIGKIKLKSIESVLEENFLTSKQLTLSEFISEYYISPLGVVMKNFIPKRMKGRKQKIESVEYEKPVIELTKEQRLAVSEITDSKKTANFLLFGPSGSGKTEVYIHSILELRKKESEGQFLILLPEKTLTPQAVERYGAYFGSESIAVLSSSITKGQFYDNWKKIRSGEAKIIIGTRMAVFAPFDNLKLVVIDEEQDISFKQWDMNPRYDARTVAQKLAEIHRSKIVSGSATPSVASYHEATAGKTELLILPELKIPGMKHEVLHTTTEVVDMRRERWQSKSFGQRQQQMSFSCISKKLKSEISYALKYGLQTILFINRQGMSSFSVCSACKTVLRCPKCDRALVYGNSGEYRCIHCSYKTSITPECEKCKGIVFRNVGLGTQKVEKEIKEMFPGARVIRADSTELKGKDAHEKIYHEFAEKKADILIGTQIISKGWDLPNVSLVGIIDADNLLTLPDFSAQERAFDVLMQVAGRTSRPGAKYPGVVLIQTYQPENNLIKCIAEKNFKDFYEKELSEREVLHLPPFGRIIKITYQDYKKEKVDTEAQRVFELLSSLDVKVAEPQDSFVSKVRGRFRKQIIIKFKKDLPVSIEKAMRALPGGWIIDVDPISII